MAATGDFSAIPLCEGKEGWRYRIFLTTNEDCQEAVLERLASEPLVGNTAIGVSSFFILNAVAARGSEGIENIVLVDCSLRVEHFWGEMQKVMAEARCREDVVGRVKELIIREKNRYFSGCRQNFMRDGIEYETAEEKIEYRTKRELSKLDTEIVAGHSWLSNDEKFEKIQKIFDAGKFVFLRIDLFESSSTEALYEVLKEKGFTVDMIYTSNVWDMLYAGNFANLRQLNSLLSKIGSSGALCIKSKLFCRRLTLAVSVANN